ncbi:hypothetical protein E4T56_gene6730 [Termitomyces sp. T112]|nr:hypothetical protein E4T56_gene6730 [Termitomyces sp. T112]
METKGVHACSQLYIQAEIFFWAKSYKGSSHVHSQAKFSIKIIQCGWVGCKRFSPEGQSYYTGTVILVTLQLWILCPALPDAYNGACSSREQFLQSIENSLGTVIYEDRMCLHLCIMSLSLPWRCWEFSGLSHL